MQRATLLLVGAVLAGLLATQAFGGDLPSRSFLDGGAAVLTVSHHGGHGPHPAHRGPGYDRHGYSRSYHYRPAPYVYRPPIHRPPAVIYRFPPPPPPVVFPPLYPPRHICGPGCGCGYPYEFYYRGNGWGFSFGF
ncbi:MAG TPA: hypothetical protein PLF81_28095 [Candidatus Anammoximicrobium sp.]|nr:hypothetical protein [Candidatus Anammoximicrobium sp.]